jgi:hypothetical protein
MNDISHLDEIKGLGILILGEKIQKFSSGKKIGLKFIAQLPDENDDELNLRWVRSLFFSCTSKSNQIAMGGNLLKSKVIFPDDLEKVHGDSPMIRIVYSLDLEQELDLPLSNDSYYVQVSARHYVSNMVEVKAT